MRLRRRATWLAAFAAGLASTLVLVEAQFAIEPQARTGQPVSSPAIDRGYLDDGTVVGPRHARPGRVTRLAGDGRTRYVPGRLIVKFKAGAPADTGMSVARRIGARSVTRPAYGDYDVMAIDPAADAEALADELALSDAVEYAQASYVVHAQFKPNDPLYDRQWNLQVLGMEQAWDINRGASDTVTVAVVDSGVAFTATTLTYTGVAWTDENGVRFPPLGRVTVPFAAAPELADSGRFVSPHDFIWNDNLPVDLDGHGTHVSGTIGQLTNNGVGVAGVAFNVRLMPVKVISGDWDDIFNSPEVGTDEVVAAGVRYAADNGAKVINMSIGRTGPAAPVVTDALRYAVGRGAFIAISAGNDYEDGNPIEVIAQPAASIDGVMAVGSVGPDLKRAFYSGVQNYVEIAAPGGNSRLGPTNTTVLQQTYDPFFTDLFLSPARYGAPRFDIFGYVGYQGTSMAAPHVSGLAALLMSQGITSPAAIELAIRRFATDAGTPGRDNEFGFGIINPRATLRGLGLLK